MEFSWKHVKSSVENEHILLSTDFTFWGLCAHRDHRDLDDHRDGKAKKKARQKGKRASGRFQESEVDDRMHIWEKRFTLSPILKTFGVNVRIGYF